MTRSEIFEEIKGSCCSYGEARRKAVFISQMSEENQKITIKAINTKLEKKD